MKVDELHKNLTDSGYLCTRQFAAQVSASINNKPVAGAFLYGSAGTGKSYLPMIISKITGHKMFFFQCAPGTKEDDLLMKMWPDEKSSSGVKISPGAVYEAAEASKKQKVILVLDEWDKTRPTADAFLLDFFQYGRISIPGKQTTANFKNLVVFFTANDERDFGEAFQRRFPKIDMMPLSPRLVKDALSLTHKDHPYLTAMIMLYKRTLIAKLPKAATIQELRQLLDAIDHLGEDADWNTLVYQFVTKTEENHLLLSKAEDKPDKSIEREVTKLQASAYTSLKLQNDEGEVIDEANMPHPVISRDTDIQPEDTGETVLAEDSTLLLEKTKAGYTFAYHLSEEPTDHSGKLEWAKVCGSRLMSDKAMYIEDAFKAARLYQEVYKPHDVRGEVLITEPLATFDDLQWIISTAPNLHVLKITKDEAVCRVQVNMTSDDYNEHLDKIDIRWTKQGGLDLICQVKYIYKALEQVFGLMDTGSNASNNLLSYQWSPGYNEYVNATNKANIVGSLFLKAFARRKHTYTDCMFDGGWGLDNISNACKDKDIPMHREFVRLDKMVVKPTKLHKTYTYNNVEWKFYHQRHKRNVKLRLRIKGKVDEVIWPWLRQYSWFGNIPFTKACTHSQEHNAIKERMLSDGWKVHQDSTTFHKKIFQARVLDNVIVFSTCVESDRWPKDNFEKHVNTCIAVLGKLCETYGDK